MTNVQVLYNQIIMPVFSVKTDIQAGRSINQVVIEIPIKEQVYLHDEVYVTISPIDLEELVGMYHLDRDANDYSRGTNHGVLNGNFTWQEGDYGWYPTFDGSTSFISVEENGILRFQNLSFAISFYIKTTELGTQCIIEKSGTPSYAVLLSNGKVQFYQNDGSATVITGNETVNDGLLHHVCVMREFGVSNRIYVDGVLDVSGTSGTSIIHDSSNTLYFGHSGNGIASKFVGSIDEVLFFRRTISEMDIGILGTTKQAPITIFGGNVIDKQDRTDRYVVACDSFGAVLRDSFLEDVSYTNKSLEYIVRDVIETKGTGDLALGTGLVYVSDWTSGTTTSYRGFGQIIDVMNDLSKMADAQYSISYNKLFKFQPGNLRDLDRSIVVGKGADNARSIEWVTKESEVYNTIYLQGGNFTYHTSQGGRDWHDMNGVIELYNHPISSVRIIRNDYPDYAITPLELIPEVDYNVDLTNDTATLVNYLQYPVNASFNVFYDYVFVPFVKVSDDSGIAQYGEKSKKVYASWITKNTQAISYARSLLQYYRRPRRAGTINMVGMRTDITEIATILVSDPYATPPIENERVEIKGINWVYPAATTKIEVGSYIPKAFDWQKDVIVRIKELEKSFASITTKPDNILSSIVSVSDEITLTDTPLDIVETAITRFVPTIDTSYTAIVIDSATPDRSVAIDIRYNTSIAPLPSAVRSAAINSRYITTKTFTGVQPSITITVGLTSSVIETDPDLRRNISGLTSSVFTEVFEIKLTAGLTSDVNNALFDHNIIKVITLSGGLNSTLFTNNIIKTLTGLSSTVTPLYALEIIKTISLSASTQLTEVFEIKKTASGISSSEAQVVV